MVGIFEPHMLTRPRQACRGCTDSSASQLVADSGLSVLPSNLSSFSLSSSLSLSLSLYFSLSRAAHLGREEELTLVDTPDKGMTG
jgi:hypothetical protein